MLKILGRCLFQYITTLSSFGFEEAHVNGRFRLDLDDASPDVEADVVSTESSGDAELVSSFVLC